MADDLKLPGILGQIAEVVGEETALKLAAEFGGRRLYVPVRPRPGDALAQALGMDGAQKVARILAGHVEIPVCRNWQLRRQLLELIKTDLPSAEIAKRLRCHERTVWRYRRRVRRAKHRDSA